MKILTELPTKFSMYRLLGFCLVFISGLSVWSCSTTRPMTRTYSATELYNLACTPGQKITSVQGDVALRIDAKELRGQYPAQVVVNAPDRLRLEINNFLGGVEAVISVESKHYKVTQSREGERARKVSTTSWGGIPLEWAAGLFLGRIPCPEISKGTELRLDTEGSLIISRVRQGDTPGEKFVYTFKEINKTLWPSALHWEADSEAPTSVNFTFFDPEKDTLSPTRWEARSTKGLIKVRWKTRQVRT